jgi:hypothetical protein
VDVGRRADLGAQVALHQLEGGMSTTINAVRPIPAP